MKNPPVTERVHVRYADLDTYGHVNNAVHLSFFEMARVAYWRRLAADLELETPSSGDLPGVRYVVAETTVLYKAPVFLGDTLHVAASVSAIGDRSYTMDFELRSGESYEGGAVAAEGTTAHVFYDPESGEVRPRPGWFLAAVAALEGRAEESFGRDAL